MGTRAHYNFNDSGDLSGLRFVVLSWYEFRKAIYGTYR